MVAWFQKFVAWWKAKPWIQVQTWASSFIMRFWTKQVQSYLLENLFIGSILHFQRGVCTRILRRWLWVPAHSVVTLGLTPFDTNVATWLRHYDTWKWLGLPSTTINMQWLKYISFSFVGVHMVSFMSGVKISYPGYSWLITLHVIWDGNNYTADGV